MVPIVAGRFLLAAQGGVKAAEAGGDAEDQFSGSFDGSNKIKERSKNMRQTYDSRLMRTLTSYRRNTARSSLKIAPEQYEQKVAYNPSLYDLDARFRIMDQFEPLRQVLTLAWPKLEEIAGADKAPELARQANDAMAATQSSNTRIDLCQP